MKDMAERRALAAVVDDSSGRVMFGAAVFNALLGPVSVEKLLSVRALTRPDDVFYQACFAAAGALLGALVAYFVGYVLFYVGQPFVVDVSAWQNYFPLTQRLFLSFATIIIAAGSFSPLPLGVFAILAGFFYVNFGLFILIVAGGKLARYIFYVWFLWKGGFPYKAWLERNFYGLSLAIAVGIMLVGILLKYLLEKL